MLGAWLRIWTPPRDAVVPPVPWRLLVLGAFGATAVAAAAYVVLAPSIESGKVTRARAAELARDRLVRAEERRLTAEQAVREGRGAPAPPAAGATGEREARRSLLALVEGAVDTDARGRVRRGELRGPILRTRCRPFPKTVRGEGAEIDLGRSVGRYECLAVTSDVSRPGEPRAGALGHPFRTRVHFPSGRFAWCKVNPRPGEGNLGRDLARVPLSPRCVGAP